MLFFPLSLTFRQRMKHPQARFYQSTLPPSKEMEGVVSTHLPRPDRARYLQMVDEEFLQANPHLREDVKGLQDDYCNDEKIVIKKDVDKRQLSTSTSTPQQSPHSQKRLRISPSSFMDVNCPLQYEKTIPPPPPPSSSDIKSNIKSNIKSDIKSADKTKTSQPTSLVYADKETLQSLSIMKNVGKCLTY